MKVTGSVAGSASGMLSIEGDGDKVSVDQVLTEGTKIATITINEGTAEEESVDLYAPEGFSGSWNDLTDKPTLFSGVYGDLTGKPYLNGSVISGNMYTNNYSENEQIVGTWIDSRPIYQKTFIFSQQTNIPSNSWFDSGFKLTDCLIVGDVKAHYLSTVNGAVYPMCASLNAGSNQPIYLLNYRNAQVAIHGFTIQYIKTTDSIE